MTQKTSKWQTLKFILFLSVGFGILLYPLITAVYYDYQSTTEVKQYKSETKTMEELKLEERIKQARAYNATLSENETLLDFFTADNFDENKLREEIEKVFDGNKIEFVQIERETITVLVDDVKISFFGYHYPLIADLVYTEYFKVASIEDVGCMKLTAIMSRSEVKDYVDLYYTIKHIALDELMTHCKNKFPNINASIIMKSLSYFDEMHIESIQFKDGFEITLNEMQTFLAKIAKNYTLSFLESESNS